MTDPSPTTPLPRAQPGDSGVEAQGVLDFLDAAADLELHSLMVVRHGAVVAEGYWRPYAADRPHMQHSAAKSWTAAAVGLAIEAGKLRLDDRIAAFFPQHMPDAPSANLLAMTVRDLLTMRTGHANGLSGGAWRGLSTSWVRAFLHEPVPHPPGETFIYSSGSSYMLSAIVTAVMGETVRDLLQRQVFRPLGLGPIGWDVSPEGLTTGGNGLSCTTDDMVRFGLLHLQGGVWQGQQVLPAWWVAEAAKPHVAEARLGVMDGRTYAAPSGPDTVQRYGYGYHWWMTPSGGYRASGLFGQQTIVLPQQDAVIGITAAIRPGDGRLTDLVWQHLAPALAGGAGQADAELAGRLAGLALPQPAGETAGTIPSRSYTMQPNEAGTTEIGFEFTRETCVFSLSDGRGTHRITAGLGRDVEGETSMTGNALHHEYQPTAMRVLARAVWPAPDRLVMTWRFIETAFCDTVECDFAGDAVVMRRRVNTNAALRELPAIEGRLIAR